MKKIIFYLILVLLLFVTYGAADLSLVDFQNKDVCPKILNIPACYIVLFAFILVLISHITLPSPRRATYYSALSIPFFLALSGSLSEISGTVVCPRTPGGTPMCYISLALCVSLILLKFAETYIHKQQIHSK